MWNKKTIDIQTPISSLLLKKLENSYSHIAYLNGNKSNKLFLALGSRELFSFDNDLFDELNAFINNNWVFGYFGYDLKNTIEPSLSSKNEDFINLDDYHFFIPEVVIEIDESETYIHYQNETEVEKFDQISKSNLDQQSNQNSNINLHHKVSKTEYLQHVKDIKQEIQLGNIYEMNFCHEFFASDVTLNTVDTYSKLNELTQAPFSCFYKNKDQFILSGSPERFLKKEGNTIISQPIKGTAKRGNTKEEDEEIKLALENDPKERSENIMIVDLVRNDLSKTAEKNSVTVNELCKIYTFETVHQMISTVTSRVNSKTKITDIIKHAFPMGSMTGAPKVEAMKIIEQHESSKRGVYSGAIGYFTPSSDFDFNVVIRSILYNKALKRCSFMVGGAITLKSDPEKEYEETLTKAQALIKALSSNEK